MVQASKDSICNLDLTITQSFDYITVHIDTDYRVFMNLFKKKPETLGLVCKICEMEFTDSDRTMRHMVKAHSKPQKAKK